MNISNEPAKIADVLKKYKTVAVVGLSDKPDRDSYIVAKYMQDAGYKIIPVNPARQEILGEKCYANLKAIPQKIEIVDVFRQPQYVPEIIDEAIAVGAKVIWMQLGVIHEEAAKKASAAGLDVVMDKCLKVERSFLDFQKYSST